MSIIEITHCVGNQFLEWSKITTLALPLEHKAVYGNKDINETIQINTEVIQSIDSQDKFFNFYIVKVDNNYVGAFKVRKFVKGGYFKTKQFKIMRKHMGFWSALKGFLVVKIFADNRIPKDALVIDIFGVVKNYRRRGIGFAMVDHIVKIAKENSLETIQVEVDATNQSVINFYKNSGFIVKKEVKPPFLTKIFHVPNDYLMVKDVS
ncbi:MAG: GNAT family N-acetyltransferase [Candidatus Hodarchaeota archaeon]